MDETPRDDPQFLELVLVFQQSAWQALGKVANPLTGKTETSLPQARHAIGMLAMLERKTAGNVSDAERRILANALTQLRLNYVETVDQQPVDKPATTPLTPEEEGADEAPDGPPDPGTPSS